MPLAALQTHLECPVCYELFDRIVQCMKGHSVCIVCSQDLDRCPICREVYLGTRNFALEDVIRKLKELKEEAAAKNVVVPVQPNIPKKPIVPAPIQGQGQFLCRVNNCGCRLPICRLHNHLRTVHPASYKSYRWQFNAQNPEFRINMIFSSNTSKTDYLQINNAGLFAVVFKVQNVLHGKRPVFCWVQAACGNHDAREFSFRLTVIMSRRYHLEYSDYVHGDQSDEAYIQLKKTCMSFNAPLYMNNITFALDIFRTVRPRGSPRGITTYWHDI